MGAPYDHRTLFVSLVCFKSIFASKLKSTEDKYSHVLVIKHCLLEEKEVLQSLLSPPCHWIVCSPYHLLWLQLHKSIALLYQICVYHW